jgi:hypothetical protein
MVTPTSTEVTVATGDTEVVTLRANFEHVNNIITAVTGTSGVLSFRHRVLYGQWDTPEAPNTLDLAVHKSIMFNGAALEALEITYTGTGSVDLVITHS